MVATAFNKLVDRGDSPVLFIKNGNPVEIRYRDQWPLTGRLMATNPNLDIIDTRPYTMSALKQGKLLMN